MSPDVVGVVTELRGVVNRPSFALVGPFCDLLKTHSRIPKYDTLVVPIMAHPFDTLAQSIWLAITACKILATLQIIPSLHRIPIILTMAKRKISIQVKA